MSVMNALKEILVDLGIEAEAISEDKLLKGNLSLDSTELVQISLDLKRRFGVDVPFESREDVTVGHVCELVSNLIAKKG
jgi:acyl carrier protein